MALTFSAGFFQVVSIVVLRFLLFHSILRCLGVLLFVAIPSHWEQDFSRGFQYSTMLERWTADQWLVAFRLIIHNTWTCASFGTLLNKQCSRVKGTPGFYHMIRLMVSRIDRVVLRTFQCDFTPVQGPGVEPRTTSFFYTGILFKSSTTVLVGHLHVNVFSAGIRGN